jgi:hypothetical protein
MKMGYYPLRRWLTEKSPNFVNDRDRVVKFSVLPRAVIMHTFCYLDRLDLTIIYNTCTEFRGFMKEVALIPKNIMCSVAAEYGYINVVSWSRSIGCEWLNAAIVAAQSGHSKLFIWICKNGYPIDELKSKIMVDDSTSIVECSAKEGYKPILQCVLSMYKHLLKEPFMWRIKYQISKNLAEGGHLQLLQWAKENNLIEVPIDHGSWIPESAYLSGYLSIIDWAHTNGISCDRVVDMSVEDGNLKVILWASKKGYFKDEPLITMIAAYGNIPLIEFALARGFIWKRSASVRAAEYGQIELLEYAKENGYYWDDELNNMALKNNKPKLFLHLHSANRDSSKYTITQASNGCIFKNRDPKLCGYLYLSN